MELQLATDVVDLSHADWRSKLFAAGCRLVDSLHSLCDGGASSGASLQSLAKSAGSALIDVLSALEVECRAVAVSIKGRGSSAVKVRAAAAVCNN